MESRSQIESESPRAEILRVPISENDLSDDEEKNYEELKKKCLDNSISFSISSEYNQSKKLRLRTVKNEIGPEYLDELKSKVYDNFLSDLFFGVKVSCYNYDR